MEDARILRIFLASPNDVRAERQLIFSLKDDLDHIVGRPKSIRFEFVNWERSAYPGIGEDAQDVINKNINQNYDIFIGIFWTRFGTPTNRSESGTKEEYERALEKYNSDSGANHIMLYFKTEAPKSIYEIDYSQFEKVKQFKTEVSKQGVLYWDFEKTEDLKNLLFLHLTSLIADKFGPIKREIENGEIFKSEGVELDKYELLVKEIEEGASITETEGIIDIWETTMDAAKSLPVVTMNITGVITFIGDKFSEKTKLVDKVNQIQDDQIRVKKIGDIVNALAFDLDDYTGRLRNLLPEFSNLMNVVIESYSKLLLLASESNSMLVEVEQQMREVVPVLHDSITSSLSSLATFLAQLRNVPPMTMKFGSAKRKAELATSELLKEFIKSNKLLDELRTNLR